MELEIETYDSTLPFELRDNPKPGGVSVVFANPKMTRSFDCPPPLVAITIYFAANVDASAVASWLYDKLNGKKRTKMTCEGAHIEISRDGIKAGIKKITYSKET